MIIIAAFFVFIFCFLNGDGLLFSTAFGVGTYIVGNLFKLITNTIIGKLRIREIAARYNLSSQTISDLYHEFYIFSQSNGLEPSMRGFEITLRQKLAEITPDIKTIEPLYCKDLDPLNP